MKRFDFTLVEVMVSIAIIAILAGMVIASLGYVARRNDEAKTFAQLQHLDSALHKYANDRGVYPITNKHGEFDISNENNVEAKCIAVIADADGQMKLKFWNPKNETLGASGNTVREYSFYGKKKGENYLSNVVVQYSEWSDAAADGEKAAIVDAWGNPIRYCCPGKHNKGLFDLWSVGPDGEDGTEDDICNWVFMK